MTERDLREDFDRYGPLRSVWIARKPPGFAFIEYEDTRDAEDAVRKMDGACLCVRRAFARSSAVYDIRG